MKLMKKFAAILCIFGLLAFTGCGEHESTKAMNDYADKVCECKDMKCIQGLGEKGKELKEKYGDAKVSEDEKKKQEETLKRMKKCMTDLIKK